MPDVWEAPKGEIHLVGTITYTCADCGERIEGEAVLAPLLDGRLLPTTRSYHPDHVPKEVPDGR